MVITDKTGKELKRHGDILFPINIYEHSGPNKDNMILRCHWHEEWELFMITEGQTLFTINGKKRLAYQNDVIFIPGNYIHMAEPFESSTCTFRTIVFDKSLLCGFNGDIIQTKYILPLLEGRIKCNMFFQHKKQGNCIAEHFIKIYNTLNFQHPVYELLVKAYIYEILAQILRFSIDSCSEMNSHKLINNAHVIKEVIEFINQNYYKPITVGQLSKIANLSPGYFTKLFKQMTSCSPIDYLLKIRLSTAARQLLETNESVLGISIDTGFNNMSYFIRAFEKKFGMSPRKYRMLKSSSMHESTYPLYNSAFNGIGG